MPASVSVYAVSASPGWLDAVSGHLDEMAGIFGTTEEFLGAGPWPGGGILLLDPDVGDGEVDALVDRLAEEDGAWSLFRGGEPDTEGGLELRPIPLPGPCAISLADVASRLRQSEDGSPPLELCGVLSFVARARHDINNPLTSALAETQLLLLDAEDPEVRAGLETVEEQLRRIRDLVGRLQALPRPREGG